MIKKYTVKDITIKALKYTKETQKHILDLLGDSGEINPLNKESEEIWISDWYGGQILKLGDYLAYTNEFIVFNDFENLYNFTGKIDERTGFEIWKPKLLPIYEAVQWGITGDNIEECLEFLEKNGSLEKTGNQILIMNRMGGSVCNKGDYVIRHKGSYFSLSEDYFKNNYVEIEEN